jgi:hypothetical protein
MKDKHEKLAAMLRQFGFKDSQHYCVFTYNNIEFDFTANSTDPELVMQTIINDCIHIGQQAQKKEMKNKVRELFGF